MADLTFDILARDRASRVLKSVGDSADGLYKKLQALDGLKGGVLAAGVPGLAGMGGLMLAGAGAATVLAPALAAVKLATQGVGDAWSASSEKGEEYQAALDELAPSAAAAVVEATALREAWGSVGDAVQEAAFAPVVGDLTRLSDNIIPALKADLPDVAGALGDVASNMMEWAGAEASVDRFRTIVQGSVPVIEDFGDAIEDVADTWTILGAGSVPVSQQLAESIGEITQRTREWAIEAERTGELDAIMASTAETVDLLGESTENLGSALGSLAANPAAIDALNDFLQIVTSLTGVVATAAEGFSNLPDGLQEFILVAAGAAVAGSKLFGMYEGITSRAREAGKAQGDAATSTSRFTQAANATALAGGRAIAVLGGMQIASALYSSTQSQTGTSTNQLQKALLEYSETGKITGEMMDLLGGKTGKLNESLVILDDDGLAGFGTGLGTVIESLTGTGAIFDDSIENQKKRLGELDQAIAGLVQSGNVEGAKAIFAALAEQAKESGVSIDELKAGLPQASALLGDVAAASDQTAQAQQRLSAQTKLLQGDFDSAIASVGGLDNAFKILNGDAMNVNTAFASYQAALDQITAANVNAKAGFDLTTEAGRNNYAMLQTAVQAMQQYAATANLTGPEIEQLREQIIQQGVAAGISRDQMVAMTNSIGAIPGQAQPAATSVAQLEAEIAQLKSKQVQIKESGSADSKSRIAALQREINALRDRTVYLTTVLRQRTEVVGSDGINRRFGGGYAKGGIQMYAAASGLVANIARPGTIYQWAEPETGGEAFIPRKGDRRRSRDILKYVAENWLGGPEAIWNGSPQQSGGVSSGGGSSFASGGGSEQIVREIRELARAISTMGISIDGQVLGRAQGRRTLLEQYGG
jgi:hypothetical protein